MTTNPTLMKKRPAFPDYEAFAKDILQTVKSKPISLKCLRTILRKCAARL